MAELEKEFRGNGRRGGNIRTLVEGGKIKPKSSHNLMVTMFTLHNFGPIKTHYLAVLFFKKFGAGCLPGHSLASPLVITFNDKLFLKKISDRYLFSKLETLV